jgi:eukaryotic-like serine/threonine-protein kinase
MICAETSTSCGGLRRGDEAMSLSVGSPLRRYEILSALGAGGMGEVYRARDTKLDREVAIKVLPEQFIADPERVARFQREAKTLAALNHPHIGGIYGLEDADGVRALVLELVEGPTLADRIAQGPIPLDEALPIAQQVAEALEAAHEAGIIHRDLKPANIKLRPDGTVKVLDFGLAKALEPMSAASANVNASPTITAPAMMTGIGMILGTAAYMSPEQAKGRPADKRSDVWAFGCVLYEMLTGRRPFAGEDVADVMVAVLSKEPDWTAIPARVPGSIRTLIRRCLEKDRRKRIADIAAALFALDEPANFGGSATVLPRWPPWRRVVMPVAAALVTSTVVGAGVWVATRPAERVPPRVSRLTLAPWGAAALTVGGSNDRDLAITPDGSRVVYVGNNGTQLLVRALDALEPVVVFTGGPRGLFVSPDGQ